MEPTSPSPREDPAIGGSSRRRFFRFAGLLALVLVGLVVYSLAQGGSDPSLNPIAEAAVRTQDSPGGRYIFHGTFEGQALPHPVVMTGTGLFNGETNRARLDLLVSTPSGKVRMESVGSGSQFYYRSKLFKDLPAEDEWMGIDASLGAASEGAFPVSSDPTAALTQLRAVSDKFERLGPKRIRGVETEGYRSTLDADSLPTYLREKGADQAAEKYERLAETAPTTTEIETWIDGKGLVRRMRTIAHTRDSSSGKESVMTVTGDFFDFGISPAIDLPDPDKVYDVTPLLEEKLELNHSG